MLRKTFCALRNIAYYLNIDLLFHCHFGGFISYFH
jgi:hypothetical protein